MRMYASRNVTTLYADTGEALLLHLRRGQFALLTPKVAMVWRRLTEGVDWKTARMEVSNELHVPADELEREANDTLTELTRLGMLTPFTKRRQGQ